MSDESNYLVESYNYFDEIGIPYGRQDVRNITMATYEGTLPDPGPGPYLVRFYMI
jgi:hypothetical protein